MKKVLLFMFALLVSVYAIGQKVQSAPSGLIDVGTPALNTSSGFSVINATPESDYVSIWTLPSTGGTSGNTRCPGNTYRYQRTEYIITAAEMAASGFPSGYEINTIGWLIAQAGLTTQTGTLNIWLMNTTDATYTLGANWTTAGFTQVHADPAFTVPIVVGEYTVPFTGGSAFTYTGGGVYVAWEFNNPSGTLGTTTLLGYCNTSLAASLYGARSSTAMPTALGTPTNFRPATKFGNNALDDIIAVTNVYAPGKVPTPYGTPASIGVRVSNVSTSLVSSFDLTITVKDSLTGTTRFTAMQTVSSLAAGASTVVSFAGWTPTLLEKVTITATTSVIPAEFWTVNNTLTDKSLVTTDVFSHNYSLANAGGMGFTYPGTGIFLSKYFMGGSGVVTGANLFMYNYAANVGNVIYAVVLNSAGTIVAQSDNDTIATPDLGTNKAFTFAVPPAFCNESFYIGMAQTALGTSTVQWYPLGTITESPVRPNTFYTSSLAGGTLNPQTADVKYALEAVVSTYTGVCAPTSFAAAAVSGTEINLNWALNLNGNPVIVAYNTTNSFGDPVNGTSYIAGSTFAGGGTVIYNGAATSFLNNGLLPSTTYYYKIWSVNGSLTYSPGVTTSAATYFGVPYSQNFNISTALPPSWSGNMYVAANHGTAASNGLTYNLYDAPTALNCSGISPHIVLSANPCRLSFDYRLVDWSGYPATATVMSANDKVEVQISTNSGTTWTTLYTIDQSNHTSSLDFASRSVNLGAYTGTTKIRFYGTWGEGDYYVDIDNFLVEELPLCASPTALNVSNLTTSTATIAWSNAPFVEIEYGAPLHTPGTGTIISPVVNNPYTITGLASGASYDVYVRQDCGSGVYSLWVGPLNFATLNILGVAPTSFDYGSVNINTTTAPQIFTITNNGTGSLIVESVGITGTDASEFLLTDGAIYPKTLLAGASYTVSVAFTPTSLGLKNASLAVAEPETSPQLTPLTGTGACLAPSSLVANNITLNSADLGWNANGTTSWEIEWGLAGFTQGTGTMISAGVTNPYALSGLSLGTAYSFYVRAMCGVGTYSAWSGPLVFMTACPVYTTPFSEGFETLPFAPTCWTRPTGAVQWNRTTSASGYGVGTATAFAYFYNYSSATPFHLMTFAFDASTLANPILKFDYAYATYINDADEMDVYYSTNGGATFTMLYPMPGGLTGVLNTAGATTDVFIPTAEQWATKTLALPAGTNMIRFTAISAWGNNLYLDNVRVEETPPPCLTPTALTAANIAATAADLDWTESGTATKWDLEYGAPGFTPGTGTMISGITAKPYHLTGLTASSNYAFIVRADCGNNNLSGWSAASQFTTISSVPEFLTVTGTYSGLPVCFNATNTITIAGNNTTFLLESGGNAIFIAGQKVSFLPGAKFNSGSYMNAYIAPAGPYCTTTKDAEFASGQGELSAVAGNVYFSIYPNPTNNNFTLVQNGDKLYGNMKVEIFSMNGLKVLSTSMIGEKQHEFKTADLPSGLYFVKVVTEGYSETLKLIKTR